MSADQLISRDREKGWVVEDDKRLVTFRLKTFQAFENRLISLVGDAVSKMILYQMGNEIGHVACEYAREAIKSESDLGPVLDSILSGRGWGRCGVFAKETRRRKNHVHRSSYRDTLIARTDIHQVNMRHRGRHRMRIPRSLLREESSIAFGTGLRINRQPGLHIRDSLQSVINPPHSGIHGSAHTAALRIL